MIGLKHDKNIYILNSVIYILVTITIYLLKSNFILKLNENSELIIIPNLLINSALTAFAPSFLIVLFFNKYLWRIVFIRKLLGIRIPFIHGRWEGYIKSIHTKHKKKHRVAIEFWQTLNKIYVWYYDENAITHSLISDFSLDSEGGPLKIFCIYLNQPIKTDQLKLQQHHGVMELYVDELGNKIIGTYYNNPFQRPTYGEIYLEFNSRKLLKRYV